MQQSVLKGVALRAAYFVYSLRWRLFHAVSVGVRLILLSNGKVLLIRHTYQSEWFLPGGGVKRGESLLEAALREAREEVGAVTVGPTELVGIYVNYDEGRNDHTAVFVCESFYLAQPSDTWEIEERAFFDLDTLSGKVSPRLHARVQDAVRGKRGIVGEW